MNYSVVLSQRALTELLESWEWYEDRQDGLGNRFRQEIEKYLVHISSNPFVGTKRRRAYFEIVVKRFPYIIIYRLDRRSKTIFVSTIFHTSRNPKDKY